MISLGPHGHEKATDANPKDIASASTNPNPSYLELRIKIELLKYLSFMLLIGPSQLTTLSIPNTFNWLI